MKVSAHEAREKDIAAQCLRCTEVSEEEPVPSAASCPVHVCRARVLLLSPAAWAVVPLCLIQLHQ